MCPKYFPCQNYENYETAHLCPGTKIGCALCDLYLPNTCGVVCPIAGFYCGNYFNFTLYSKVYKFLRYGCRQLTRFGVFQDRIMKLSG